VDYQELMAAIGRMVVDAAALEYSVAVLVALTEGHQDQAAEDRALQLARRTARQRASCASSPRDRPSAAT